MGKLLGFNNTKADTTKILDLVGKTYLNRTKGGEFNTVQEVQGLIDVYKRMPQSVEVQGKVADLENKKLQLGVKLNDILSQKNIFETDLQAGLDSSAKANFKNMKNLIGSYAMIYGDASERYDADVLSKISERYGTSGEIPQETLNYRKTLKEKATFYANLFNSYNVVDPTTGEVGALNTEGFAIQVDTNPANGAVNHIEIVPSGQVDGKAYMRTDVGANVIDGMPNKKIPIYLRTNDVGVASNGAIIKGGRLGNISYQESAKEAGQGTTGILSATKQDVGFFDKLNFFSDTPAELTNQSIDSIKNDGVSFSNSSYKYDSQDIPTGNVLKMGNRVFYSSEKDGKLLEMKGKDQAEKQANLDKYLTGIGKDSKKITPYLITKDYLVAPDGNSRVQGDVDANYFSAPTTPSETHAFSAPQATTTPEVQGPMTDSFFAQPEATTTPSSAVNRLNKPEEPSLSSQKGISISDIVEKGKSFFRNRVQ